LFYRSLRGKNDYLVEQTGFVVGFALEAVRVLEHIEAVGKVELLEAGL
jgi:hypothetical protein